jgi:hypothetical protein
MSKTCSVGPFEKCQRYRAMSEFEGQSGMHMLVLSSSEFDPQATLPASRVAVANGPFLMSL